MALTFYEKVSSEPDCIFRQYRRKWNALKWRIPSEHWKSFDSMLSEIVADSKIEIVEGRLEMIRACRAITKALKSDLKKYRTEAGFRFKFRLRIWLQLLLLYRALFSFFAPWALFSFDTIQLTMAEVDLAQIVATDEHGKCPVGLTSFLPVKELAEKLDDFRKNGYGARQVERPNLEVRSLDGEKIDIEKPEKKSNASKTSN